ncbi:EAL domain-containing protein [Methylobacterium marchantiae]|uniref:EAL domain-containing protein n=1 Tax=Methylobacterium marchantiae TaxID=600331 RepID=A0ABW3X2A7_9HYPH|nr:putative signaling protein [Methylobacterium marchantiae]
MLKVAGCFADVHDWRLVGLAAVMCALSSLSTVTLLRHARRALGRLRTTWLCIAAVAGGFGIWATHFIAMLAFAPGIASGYDLGLTLLSLALAICTTGAGLALAIGMRGPMAPWIGGMVVGAGIAIMHFTGMAAYESAAHVVWERGIVLLSILVGTILGGSAVRVAVSQGSRRIVGPALLLLAAICGLHFTAMAAVTLVPDASLDVPTSSIPGNWLAIAVAGASTAIVLLALGALGLDLHEQRNAHTAREHLSKLANATPEGLIICRGDVIVSANWSFATLVGAEIDTLSGIGLARFLPDVLDLPRLGHRPQRQAETLLTTMDGDLVPVALIVSPMDDGGQQRWAIAVRDLRSERDAESRIRYLARHDALTGLANRTTFLEALEQELRIAGATRRKLAVLRIDLDRFKDVNDLLGHEAGDRLLKLVACVITTSLAEHEILARLGGNEFALFSICDDAVDASRLAERITTSIRTGKSEVEIGASIGIAIYPDDAIEHGALARCADTALRQAKLRNRGGHRFFEARMGADVRDRSLMERQLRDAVRNRELTLVYQPQLDVGSGNVTGFEALLRWTHPTRGSVAPDLFIPIAEESDLILPIGEWSMEQACRNAASWTCPLSVAVNVSAVQLHSADFVGRVERILAETGLDPKRLEIEITETALIRDPVRALSALQQLKAAGVSIVMDDFGTGYSSLSNLRSFPFDVIKIDRSFMSAADRNEQNAAIVRSVLGLGKGLAMRVVAEGVETAEELDFLRREGCHSAQGYLIGRPAAIEDYADLTGAADGAKERFSLAS